MKTDTDIVFNIGTKQRDRESSTTTLSIIHNHI